MNLKEKLEKEILETNWEPLAPHFARGSVYLLDQDLELTEVGQAMAEDNVAQIKSWLDDGLMCPPTPEEARAFAKNADYTFKMLIIEPYVLIQKRLQA
jgi:hypothetical protein